MNTQRTYIAIDLKSFYASVECVEHGLDPLDACVVVADRSRTEKTICLAVSPALKSFGIGGRPRLFEVNQRVSHLNACRGRTASSASLKQLAIDPAARIAFHIFPPRMALYIKYSTRIYEIYLRHIAPEDIHVYSIDEVIIDATNYLTLYKLSARDLAMKMIRDVLADTGITATAGIGTNMYLCKVAMDIVAKKMEPDENGVRIAEIDELSYRRDLWDHTPLTDFWRVGRGTAEKLARHGMTTMGDIALLSLENEDLLYHLFGVNAELLIDHAWGWEPVTMDQVKKYRPENHSVCTAQVLSRPYDSVQARNVVLEMADAAALDLFGSRLATDQLVLEIGYDASSLSTQKPSAYRGKISIDRYGRKVPFHAHGTANFRKPTSSGVTLVENAAVLYDSIIDTSLYVRRISLSLNHLTDDRVDAPDAHPVQLDLFTDYESLKKQETECTTRLEKERRQQQAILAIKKKFGKNAILKGLNYTEGATQRDRNSQIGGHKA